LYNYEFKKGELCMVNRWLPLFRTPLKFFFLSLMVFWASGFSQSENQLDEINYYRGKGIQPLPGGIGDGNLAPGTYLFPNDILIEKGNTMNLVPGTTILFTQNAMLVVNGSLVCSGTMEAPVVFRRLDNSLYYQPIDSRVETRWDGIYLPDSANCKMSNTVVSDSKYGIVISGKDVSMSFDSVRFVNNKFQNVKIGNQTMKISENTPIVFNYPEQQGVFVEPAAVLNATESIQSKRSQPRHTTYPKLRVGMGITAAIGLVFSAGGAYLAYKYEPLQYDQDSGEEIASNISRMKFGRIAGVTGGILFGIGTAGFVWTFFY
jgi:hypothetical protein